MKKQIVLPSKYRERRYKSYPSIGDQLDMLWHGMDANPKLRIEPFYSEILKIKTNHPAEV